MSLVRHHSPKTHAHLVALIESHTVNGVHSNCSCGCKSAGTVKDFGKKLYDANVLFFNSISQPQNAKSLEECEKFMYSLFITNTLRGNTMENKALQKLQQLDFEAIVVNFASECNDFKFGVDLEIFSKDGGLICGIQVKPDTYKNLPPTHPVREMNDKKNFLYGKPVFYLFYDKNDFFTNLEDCKNFILSNL